MHLCALYLVHADARSRPGHECLLDIHHLDTCALRTDLTEIARSRLKRRCDAELFRRPLALMLD